MAEAGLKKQQMEYIAIGTLVLVAVLIGVSKFQKKEKDDEVFSRTEFNKKWKEVEILELKVPKEEKGVDYVASVERVPLKSPFEEESKAGAVGEDVTLPVMAFQGMVWNSRRPQAIIDNKVYDVDDVILVGEGEAAGTIKVKDITREGIFLKYKGKEFIVRPK